MNTDLVVVGSGGAGLIAALHAAVRGARVTVLERSSVFGGTTSFSGGAQWLPGNTLGKQGFDLQDSPTEAEQYLDALSLGFTPKTVRAFVREAPSYYDFVIRNSAVVTEPADIPDYYRGQPGAKGPGRCITIGTYDTSRLGSYKDLLRVPAWPGSVYITHGEEQEMAVGQLDQLTLLARAAERRDQGIAVRGRALIGGLMEACLEHDVQLVENARATGLIQDAKNGRVTGVRAVREGKPETYEASRGVVLASGGFEWNPALWNQLLGVPFDGPKSPPNNEGDGLRMALRAGARLGNVNQVWWSPGGMQIPGETYEGKQRTRSWGGAHGRVGAIMVNRQGKRFMNENMPYYDAGKPMVYFDAQRLRFPNHPAFAVMDRDTYERAPLNRDLDEERYPSSGWLFEAQTLDLLAERMGIDADGLTEQVSEWNRNCEKGVDPDFHRGEFEYDLTREPWPTIRASTKSGLKNPLLRPIDDGPYYAVEVKATAFGTKGGAVIDEEARVLGYDDKPIAGLFAAGNVTACVYGPASPGGGSTLGPALTFGWVAGRSATA